MTDNIISLDSYRKPVEPSFTEEDLDKMLIYDSVIGIIDLLSEHGYNVQQAPLTMREFTVIMEAMNAILYRINDKEHSFHKVSEQLVDMSEEEAELVLNELVEE